MIRRERKKIRDILELVRRYDSGIGEILSRAEQSRSRACEALRRLQERRLDAVLQEMDVESVNRDRLGIRTACLRAAGITSMAQLCTMTAGQINDVSGIGDDSAELIHSIASRIRREAGEGLRVAVDMDDRNEDASELLLAAGEAVHTASPVRKAERLYEQYHDRIAGDCLAARPAAGLFRWFFAPEDRKNEALEAAERLYELLEGAYGQQARSVLLEYDETAVPDAETVWEEFEKNSAAYYAQLDRLAGEMALRIDNSYSGLPADLVRDVEMQPICVEKLRAVLRPYQEFGVRYILRQGNVLLGDEMGLGKTVQATAAMVSLRAVGGTHFMVVCPAGVLVNWSRELRKFSDLDVTVIRGADEEAVLRWREKGGAAVTTYESIRRFSLPEDFRFSMLVADEAHYVKNPAAQRTRALLLLRRHADRVLFMTGTPLENRVDEMCFLVSCLRPDIGGEITKMRYISIAPQFREKLAPVYLRRTREDVLKELPELIQKEQWCEMGPEEWSRYLQAVADENFMAMRRVSWDTDLRSSSKAARLLQLCRQAEEEGRKVIVFSYFRETVDAAARLLGSRALEPVTGSVPPEKRQQIVDAFTQAGEGTVLICQIQAGGTGMNIQAASVVIFCEPQLKPSAEEQAVSRAYRMGQMRSVIVHRLLCDNTVDERILDLLREKQDLFDTFADESETGNAYLRKEKSLRETIVRLEKERLAEAASLTGERTGEKGK